MKKSKRLDPGSLNDLIDELTAEAGSDDEQIWNFQQALQKHIWQARAGATEPFSHSGVFQTD
jgi:hypothetical protein